MASGEQIGGHADRAVFAGAVGGGDCGGGEGIMNTKNKYFKNNINYKFYMDYQ